MDQCPTCGSRIEEPEPGFQARFKSTYRLDGEDHPCDCWDQIALYNHYLIANIPSEYMSYTADDWVRDPKALEEIHDYIDHWEGYGSRGIGLAFYCKRQGTGKTFLATYVARAIIRMGEKVQYLYFKDLIHEGEHKPSEQTLRETKLLVLDEVIAPWTDRQKEFFSENFEGLIRYRMNFNNPTIFTTNLTKEDLEAAYPRVASLLSAKQKTIQINDQGDIRRQEMFELHEIEARNGERRPIC